MSPQLVAALLVVAGEATHTATGADLSPGTSRPPVPQQSGPTAPAAEDWRSCGEGCGGRDSHKGFGWGDRLMAVLCPEGFFCLRL